MPCVLELATITTITTTTTTSHINKNQRQTNKTICKSHGKYLPSMFASTFCCFKVGDVVLVEKVSRSFLVKPNDIVYFRPPPVLQDIVSRAGGTLSPSDLFVKRVAALPGDTVTVSADGSVDVRAAAGGGGGNTRLPKGKNRADNGGGAAGGGSDINLGDGVAGQEERAAAVAAAKGGAPAEGKVALPDSVLQRIARLDEKVLPSGSVFVLGDNPAASMDSRVWGQLDKEEIVGHALLRVFPPRSFGLLQ